MPIIRDTKGRILKGSSGRPKGAKNKLTRAKDNLIKLLNKKLKEKNVRDKVDLNTLIRFAATIMPKETSLRIAPDIEYLSQITEPQEQGEIKESGECKEEGANTLTLSTEDSIISSTQPAN